jgi:hypothetical protein
MADHTKVVVYIRAKDVRMLKERNIADPAMWTRATVKDALAAEREALATLKAAGQTTERTYIDPGL